jgi:hypothetical protein
LEAAGLIPGIGDGDIAHAQNLNAAFTNLQTITGFAQRAALLSSAGLPGQQLIVNGGFETGNFSGWTQINNTGFTSVVNNPSQAHSGNDYMETGPVSSLGGITQTVATNSGIPYTLTFWTLNQGGTPNEFQAMWDNTVLEDDVNAPTDTAYQQHTYTVTGTGSDSVTFQFRQDPNYWRFDDVSLVPATSPSLFYYFTLGAGQRTTLAATGGVATLQLQDGNGNVLATGTGGSTNVTSEINNFQVANAGTYYAVVTTPGGGGAYNLVVTRGAAFDTHPNQSSATAQDITGATGVLGAIMQGGGTNYSAAVVPFTFEDISTTGTVITGLDNQDDASVSVPIGFNFPFYNNSYNSIFVSSNGLLTFGSGNTEFTNQDMTADPTQAAIAPYWDDQILTSPPEHVYMQVLGTGNNMRLDLQFNVHYFNSGGTITYEAQLYADGRIQFNYQNLVGLAGHDNGASATVGIKDAGTQGANRLLLAFNNGPNQFVNSGVSTLISLPAAEDWYAINVTSLNTQIFLATATPGDGPGEPVNVLNPHIQLFDPNGVLIATGTTMADGRNELIKLPAVTLTGTYKVRVTGENNTSGDYFLSATTKVVSRGMGPISPLPPAGGKSDGSVIKGILPPLMSAIGSTGSTSASPAKTTGTAPVSTGLIQSNGVRAVTPTSQHSTLDAKALAHFFAKPAANLSVTTKLVDALMEHLNA